MDIQALYKTIRQLNYFHDKKTTNIVKSETLRIIKLIDNNAIDFTVGLKKYNHSHNQSRRFIARYSSAFDEGYAVQRNLAHQISRSFRIVFPNRASMIHELFECTKVLKLMMNFTIVRFDFKGYFYTIKPKYVWDKILKDQLPEYTDKALIELFCNQIDIAYPGLEMSNVLAELLGIEFDRRLKSLIQEFGIMFYGRFVDDGIIILRERVEKDTLLHLMQKALRETYQSRKANIKCTTKFHENGSEKFKISSLDEIFCNQFTFSFLGYKFVFEFEKPAKKDLKITYGIDDKKIDKYQKRLSKVLDSCLDLNQLALVLRLYCARVVYSVDDGKVDSWKEKGFVSTYKELKMIEPEDICPSTKGALESLTYNAICNSKWKSGLPPSLSFQIQKHFRFDYLKAIQKGKTIVFDFRPGFGVEWKTLLQFVRIMGVSPANKGYRFLTKELLIKTKIGY